MLRDEEVEILEEKEQPSRDCVFVLCVSTTRHPRNIDRSTRDTKVRRSLRHSVPVLVTLTAFPVSAQPPP